MTCNGDGFPYGAGQTLTQDQIRSLWLANGGQAGLADVMSAIALAESSGHTSVVNDCGDSGDFSVGLWQINYFAGLLGPRSQRYGSPQQLAADPNLQAKAAVDLAAAGQGLGNWSTYSSGAYQTYLNGAPSMGGGNSSVGGATLASSDSTSSSGDGGEQCIIKAPSQSFWLFSVGGGCLLGTSQARAVMGVGIVGGGAVLLAAGLLVIISGSKAGTLAAGLAKVPGIGTVAGVAARAA